MVMGISSLGLMDAPTEGFYRAMASATYNDLMVREGHMMAEGANCRF